MLLSERTHLGLGLREGDSMHFLPEQDTYLFTVLLKRLKTSITLLGHCKDSLSAFYQVSLTTYCSFHSALSALWCCAPGLVWQESPVPYGLLGKVCVKPGRPGVTDATCCPEMFPVLITFLNSTNTVFPP